MTKKAPRVGFRELSMTPRAIAAREHRSFARVDKQEAKWHKQIEAYMKANNASYDEAFVACGGMIVTDEEMRILRLKAWLKEIGGTKDKPPDLRGEQT